VRQVLCLALYLILNERKFSAMSPEEIGDILTYPWHGRFAPPLTAPHLLYLRRPFGRADLHLPNLAGTCCC
jgi:hypothetical protein